MDPVSASVGCGFGALVGCSSSVVVLPVVVVGLVAIRRAERSRAGAALWRATEPSVSAWSSAGGREVFVVHLDGERVRVSVQDSGEALICSSDEWARLVREKGYRLRQP